ncbi:hypothetical protein HAZT_HAZT009189 [Hyalella azteca]|uniref:Methyltransferase FkbM domain-containing protein n=1 Tax=Hyalella azteca TaxID=294128 RepID=A0A6A0GUC8_HYAAZ|nr:hypothetical protein HAZT_HAZT009189 [Hyalella azteca]
MSYCDFSGLEADDARLIEYIRQHVIVPPSTEPYNLYYGVNHDPSDGQSKVVDELLNHKRNGFYVESGGYTGEVRNGFYVESGGYTGEVVVFKNEKYAGRIYNHQDLSYPGDSLDLSSAKCFPLYSFLLALGTTTVDYFSLDVESSEYKVLQSIPWDKLDIKTLSVEYNLIPEGKPALIDLMKSKEILCELYRETM